MLQRFSRLTALTIAALALAVPSAVARPATPGVLHVGFPLASAFPGALSVSVPIAVDAGDVDGDGLEDTAVAVPADDGDQVVWVTFAAGSPSAVEAGGPGWRGFAITGTSEIDGVTGVGDTNGDGVGDIAISTAAATYVVYGRRDGGTTDLRALGAGGFTIEHAWPPGGPGGGSGDVTFGYATTGGVTAVGDEDGDGRADVAVLALPDGGGALRVAVVRSPATAGATVDAASPADQVFSLGWASNPGQVYLGTLGDLDGDGRQDLAVSWSTPTAVHLAGVFAPAPGTDVALEDVATDHRGFLYTSDAAYDMRGMTTVGDQNGDGHRDTEVMAGRVGREVNVLPSLPAGTERTFSPATSRFGMYADAIVPVGDQDGDGREDVTDMGTIHYANGTESRNIGRAGVYLVGSVADRDGDGRRELLGLHADPFNDPDWSASGTATAKYQLETYFGFPADCCPVAVATPTPTPTTPQAIPPKAVTPVAVRHIGKKLTGTRKADRLTGTAYADVIKGMAGNDTIKGLGGNDTIDGGAGRDHIDAGAGNDHIAARDGAVDTIVCGAGKDTVVADRGDKVRGCEKVSRPKARKPRHR
jgi:hypothetical protein